MVAASHDLAALGWIRQRGNTLMARIEDGGEMRVFAVAPDGLTPLPRNLPRLFHEGNWSGALSVAINIVTSIAMVLLMATGLVLWARRKFRPRSDRGRARAAAATTSDG